ncbi:hemerythrin [Sulfuriferula sp. AH1]|uniref:hemerythrin domain-containing protein n=1 Tax=Sulfuriferula sp. AH1 TaxID=1985873 RepID=UPI000B3B2A20|nr:hemerythrin domain-containing protein [Sulfuriferula sp. AH1]ARU31315.1 hemerythrin [Sulfuriferula sp. AH1]
MTTESNDLITLLVKDHKEVKEMFEEFESLSDHSKASKKKIADQICQVLTVHAQVEEEILYPAVRSVIKGKGLVDEAIVEHASAKELIAHIRNMDPGDDLYDARLKVLSEQVEHHVEEEENKMFPQMRQADLDLVTLGKEIMSRKEQLESDAGK